MPHTHTRHGSSGDDLGSTDEVKVFKDEGDREDEKISSENLLVEEKSSLIDLTESEEKGSKTVTRPDHSPVFNKLEPHTPSFNMGYLVSPYSYANGAPGGLPVTMASKIGLPPFFCPNGDPLTTPPPAHCGIPPYRLDPKTMGLPRPALYPFAASQYPYPMLSPDMSQVASWHTPSVYSSSSFRTPYPSTLPISTTLSSDFPFSFSPNLLPSVHASPHHVLNSHPSIVASSSKQDCSVQDITTNNRYSRNLDSKSSSNSQANDCKDNSNDKKKPHIKKPLNAFMLYMKEMRAKVVAECTLKESAAINQILGRRWHALGREEQAKYYELARRERQLHMQMYPDWSSRTNASRGKKRKRKQDATDAGGNNMKKCRARFGLDQQNQWCKPCRRKKKCIRYMEALNGIGAMGEDGSGMDDTGNISQLSDDDDEDDDLGAGSCGSADEVERNKAPDTEDNESMNHSLSSPGCLSGLSSLQSPSTTTSLASPLNANMLTSPATPSVLSLSLSVNNSEHASATTPYSQPRSGSGSSSGSTCSINHSINTPNTSSTTSPATTTAGKQPTGPVLVSATTSTSSMSSKANERAMMLGTRFSHLGMGLSLPGGGNVDQMFHTHSHTQPHTHLAVSIANMNTSISNSSSTPTSSNTAATNNSNPITSTSFQTNNICNLSNYSKNKLSTTTVTATTSAIAAVSTPAALTPVATSLHRNPIGANPHDINNPLSINQLTKRRVIHNIPLMDGCDAAQSINMASASATLRHNHNTVTPTTTHHHRPYSHAHSHPQGLPPPHHSFFANSNFSQQFHQHLSNHLAATTATTGGVGIGVGIAVDSGSGQGSELPTLKHRSTSEAAAAASSSATPNASEPGAISVS
ncbi:protein pangolin, isoforms A/H/I/S isoform X6 [Drosophila busckii]|uniref:protein pangolin, isoforms A/H/I/S isoform X6 n=1 Tax=Drosophila busckii TaxID=30019 RepID=UPI00083F1425|nr:protein pangolin, isoforms A/H/I/S isoform X6 [Drosophila busckii]